MPKTKFYKNEKENKFYAVYPDKNDNLRNKLIEEAKEKGISFVFQKYNSLDELENGISYNFKYDFDFNLLYEMSNTNIKQLLETGIFPVSIEAEMLNNDILDDDYADKLFQLLEASTEIDISFVRSLYQKINAVEHQEDNPVCAMSFIFKKENDKHEVVFLWYKDNKERTLSEEYPNQELIMILSYPLYMIDLVNDFEDFIENVTWTGFIRNEEEMDHYMKAFQNSIPALETKRLY